MPTKNELERQNKSLRSHVILYTIIIIACLLTIVWLTYENMMLQPETGEPCFHSFEISYECNQEGFPLVAKTNETGKYFSCGDIYEVRAC
jgi:hypothetical protein